MAGASLTITVNDAAVTAALRALAQAIARPRAVMAEIGQSLKTSTQERFRREIDPDGNAWKPSRRKAEGSPRPTLTLNGYLRGSITRRATDDSAVIGTNVIYAATHQFGGTITPKKPGGRLVFTTYRGDTIFAKAVTIPARPFLGLSADDRVEIREIVADAIARAVRRQAGGPRA